MELQPALILLVASGSDVAPLTSRLERWDGCRVLSVPDMQTALARIGGGGVELVVASVSSNGPPRLVEWEAIRSLRRQAPQVPVIVLCAADCGGESLGWLASDRQAYLVERSADLAEAARNAFVQLRGGVGYREGAARIIAFEGAKGGVGTTTLALNVAAELARHGKTVLAELRSEPGTLPSHFGLERRMRTVADLAAASPDSIQAADVKACLWSCDQVPGLTVLFGPQSLQAGRNLGAGHIDRVLRFLSESAEYLVVDLPHGFSESNRAALRASDWLVLVLERDHLCLDAAKVALRGLEAEELLPQSVGLAVVSRIALAAPAELSEVERTLGVPTLGAIPPAPDLCLMAHKAHQPVVTFHPGSLLAESFVRMAASLGRKIASARPALPLRA